MWQQDSTHCKSHAEIYGLCGEVVPVRNIFKYLLAGVCINPLYPISSTDPLSESSFVFRMLQEVEEKSRLLEEETKRILKFLKVSYIGISIKATIRDRNFDRVALSNKRASTFLVTSQKNFAREGAPISGGELPTLSLTLGTRFSGATFQPAAQAILRYKKMESQSSFLYLRIKWTCTHAIDRLDLSYQCMPVHVTMTSWVKCLCASTSCMQTPMSVPAAPTYEITMHTFHFLFALQNVHVH